MVMMDQNLTCCAVQYKCGPWFVDPGHWLMCLSGIQMSKISVKLEDPLVLWLVFLEKLIVHL